MEPDTEHTVAARKPPQSVEHEAPDLENTIITRIADAASAAPERDASPAAPSLAAPAAPPPAPPPAPAPAPPAPAQAPLPAPADDAADTKGTVTAQASSPSTSLEELANLATAPISLPELREPAARVDDGASTLPAYSFRIGVAAEPVSLDTVVYVGRKPSPPRIAQSEPRRLVTVDSPKGEVSSTHLELRQRGSSVVITDLRSTNGTTVVIPGSAPRRMRQGESVVVTPGTFIDIGDGNIIEILATRLRYTKGGIE